MEKNQALSVDQHWLQALQLSVWFINLLSILLRDNVFTRIQKVIMDQSSRRPPNSDRDHFWYKLGFRKCPGASWSNHWVGHRQMLYIHFSSRIKIWWRNGSLLLYRTREDDTSKQQFFWFAISSQGTHLSSFFIFPICFKCWMTMEWSTLSSAVTCVVVRG